MRIAQLILAAALLAACLAGHAATDMTGHAATDVIGHAAANVTCYPAADVTGHASSNLIVAQAYALSPDARAELVAFVKEAKDLVLKEGKDKALAIFNDPHGEFVRGDLYIIGYDFNGTRLAHPYLPQTIGKNELNATDPNGVALGRNLREEARRGGGFSYYIWPNPAHSNALELKLAYALKVDEDLWLGSGVYLSGQAPAFSNQSREELVAFVKRAKQFALNSSRDAALKAFNDRNGEFVRGNRYIFAYDFQGKTLALPFEPELIGTNRLDLQDPNGVPTIQSILDAARIRSGFVYVIYQDPTENMTIKLKLEYVTPVNDEWFLGSGIYYPEHTGGGSSEQPGDG
jgi:signal transduction histidine kinase